MDDIEDAGRPEPGLSPAPPRVGPWFDLFLGLIALLVSCLPAFTLGCAGPIVGGLVTGALVAHVPGAGPLAMLGFTGGGLLLWGVVFPVESGWMPPMLLMHLAASACFMLAVAVVLGLRAGGNTPKPSDPGSPGDDSTES